MSLRRLLAVLSSLGVSSSIGCSANRGIVEQHPEWLQPKAALADVLVAVDAAAAWLLRVIQVKSADAPDADDPVEAREGGGVAFRTADVIAGGEQMARVEADADSGRAVAVDQ